MGVAEDSATVDDRRGTTSAVHINRSQRESPTAALRLGSLPDEYGRNQLTSGNRTGSERRYSGANRSDFFESKRVTEFLLNAKQACPQISPDIHVCGIVGEIARFPQILDEIKKLNLACLGIHDELVPRSRTLRW